MSAQPVHAVPPMAILQPRRSGPRSVGAVGTARRPGIEPALVEQFDTDGLQHEPPRSLPAEVLDRASVLMRSGAWWRLPAETFVVAPLAVAGRVAARVPALRAWARYD